MRLSMPTSNATPRRMQLHRIATSLTYVVSAVALAGCSVRGEPVITAADGKISSGQTIRILPADEGQGDRLAFQGALATAFANAGYRTTDAGAIVAEFALSSIEADAALYFSEAGANAPAPTPVVVSRRARIVDGCKAQRTRAKLVAFSLDTGNLIASSEAEAISCADDDPPYSELASLLVAQVIEAKN